MLDLWRACAADLNAAMHRSDAQPAVAESVGRGRRIMKPETAAFRASFTQAAAAAASTSLVSQMLPWCPCYPSPHSDHSWGRVTGLEAVTDPKGDICREKGAGKGMSWGRVSSEQRSGMLRGNIV